MTKPTKRTPTTRTKRTTAPTIPRMDDLPDLLTPDEGRQLLRISRNGMYEMLKTGAIPHLKFGRLIRIKKNRVARRA